MKAYVHYSDDIAQEILETVASAQVGLRQLCVDNPHWPAAKNIMKWKREHPEFGARYARAKQDQIELIIDDVLEIADDKSQDRITKLDAEGNEYTVCNHEFIQRSRVRIDTRKWLAAKLLPKLYGDRLIVEKDTESESLIDKARTEVARLKEDDHGRSTTTED